jgi:hypothetical protein
MILVRLSPDHWLDRLAVRLQQQPVAITWRLALLSVLGAVVPAISVYIGTRYLTTAWDFELGYTPVSDDRIDPFRATLIGLLFTPWLIAAAMALLAPLFDRPRQPRAALATAVIGTVPLYVSCSFLFFLPALFLVFLAFLVSCLWWGAAAQRLLGVDSAHSAGLTAASLLAASVVLQFLGGWLAGLL